ncbi:MAG: peptidylprolyl isomerase [Geobacteraceae bacterium]|nr:peptidylprolyl isomerase [Geobacteraceae bacterium]
MNKIERNSVVTLAYTVVDADGNVIDEGKEPLEYLHGGYNLIFIPVEAALHGKAVGDSIAVKLQPADAFGEYDPELINIVPVEELPQPLTVGMQIEGTPEGGGDEERFFATVTDIAEGKAVLDGNHPLAGIALLFAGTVQQIRPATEAEIAAVPTI